MEEYEDPLIPKVDETVNSDIIEPSSQNKPKKIVFTKTRALILIGLILIGASVAVFLFIRHRNNSITPVASISSSTKPVEVKKAEDFDANLAVSYLNAPLKVPSLDLFKNTDYFGLTCLPNETTNCNQPIVSSNDINYYQIGTRKSDKAIVYAIYITSIRDGNTYYAVKQNDTYTILFAENNLSNSDAKANAADVKLFSDGIKPGVIVDTTTRLGDLNFAKEVDLNGKTFVAENQLSPLASLSFMENGLSAMIKKDNANDSNISEPSLIGSNNGIEYFKVSDNRDTNYSLVDVYATYKNMFSTTMTLKTDFLLNTSEKLVPVKASWQSGDLNLSSYYSAGTGCGTFGYVSASNIQQSDLKLVGTTAASNTKLYQLPSTNPLVKLLYSEYGNGDQIQDKSLKNLSIDQFALKHAYFLAQNSLGDWVVALRDDMRTGGGCGKPVIYLYPQNKTAVSVSVGANVVKSVPDYPVGGWQNVIANPG